MNSPIRKQALLVFVFALIFLLYMINVQELNIFTLFGKQRRSFLSQRHIINITGCKIPFLDIYDEEIVDLLSEPNYGYSCGVPLVFSNLTSLYLDPKAFKKHGIKHINQVHCHYKPFWRVNPTGKEADHRIKYGEKHYFQNSVDVHDEFVRVECEYNGRRYKDFHSFVVDKKPMSQKNTTRAINDDKLNVIIIGIDSLSRLHFHRKMPRTAKFLLEELNAIEYFGYNKLADNTFPNLMPVFTGYSFEELIKVC